MDVGFLLPLGCCVLVLILQCSWQSHIPLLVFFVHSMIYFWWSCIHSSARGQRTENLCLRIPYLLMAKGRIFCHHHLFEWMIQYRPLDLACFQARIGVILNIDIIFYGWNGVPVLHFYIPCLCCQTDLRLSFLLLLSSFDGIVICLMLLLLWMVALVVRIRNSDWLIYYRKQYILFIDWTECQPK